MDINVGLGKAVNVPPGLVDPFVRGENKLHL